MDAPLRTPAPRHPLPWPAARLAAAGMRACAVITCIDLMLSGAAYEDQVAVATHDGPAVPVLGFLAALIELVVPLDVVLAVTGSLWSLTVAVTVAAFLSWLVHMTRTGRRSGRGAPPGRWWAALLVPVPLVAAGAVCRVAVVSDQVGGEQLREARVFVYLLWTAAAAAVWYTAALGRKLVRRITETRAARG